MAAIKPTLPDLSSKVLDNRGYMALEWYRYFEEADEQLTANSGAIENPDQSLSAVDQAQNADIENLKQYNEDVGNVEFVAGDGLSGGGTINQALSDPDFNGQIRFDVDITSGVTVFVPLTTGEEPISFVSDGQGQVVMVPT